MVNNRNESSVPPTQTVIQNGVISLKYNHAIKPTLRKEITAMVVHNVSPLFHNILKFITNLQKPCKIDIKPINQATYT